MSQMPVQIPSLITTPLLVVSVIFPVLSLISIFVRWRARRVARQAFLADDWWIVGTWVLTLGMSVHAWVFAPIIGINYVKNPMTSTSESLKCLLVAGSMVQLPLSAVKISILLFYKRIFDTLKFRISSWIAIFVVSCWGIVFFLLALLQGDPFSYAWGEGPGRLRFDSTKLGLAQVGTSLALDVVVLLFPLPVISRLRLETKRKVAVGVIFWLGSFCCVAAIVRLILLNQSIRTVIASFDSIYIQSKNYIFMILEPNCSIIAACLPCYGPLLRNGRSQSSIVRSVRSLFSMRSLFSIRSQSASAGNSNYAKFGEEANTHGKIVLDAESRMELKYLGKYSNDGSSIAVAEQYPCHGSGELGSSCPGITVTKSVRVE